MVSRQLRQYYVKQAFYWFRLHVNFVTMKQTKLAVELLAQGDKVVVWGSESSP